MVGEEDLVGGIIMSLVLIRNLGYGNRRLVLDLLLELMPSFVYTCSL